ncbi:MAG: alpha-glucosidase [Myxococcota bacterium]
MRRAAWMGMWLGLIGCQHKVSPLPAPQGGMLNDDLFWALEKQRLAINTAEGRTVFAVPLGRAFLTAAVAEPEITSVLGTFHMDQKILGECNNTSIIDLEAALGTLTVTGALGGRGCVATYTLVITPDGDDRIRIRASVDGEGVNRLNLTMRAGLDERFLGLGEQFTHVEFRGERVPMLSEEQGIGRGAQPITAGANLTAGKGVGGTETSTYFPIPFVLTTDHRALALDGTAYNTLDFSDPLLVTVEAWSSDLSATVYWADDPRPLLAAYTEETGRMPPLPEWAHGTILGVQGGTERVSRILDDTMKAGSPVTGVWIQDWEGRRITDFGAQLWWRWTPDEQTYPDLLGWSEQLKEEKDVRLLGYINPFLATEGEMFDDASAQDLLLKTIEGEVYIVQTAGFPAALLDLSKPEAEQWIKDIIRDNLIGNGLSGWMADFSEWLPMDTTMADGTSSQTWHNRYPVEWARINREVLEEEGLLGEVFFFMRAGYAGSAGHSTLFWEGDQMVSWDENDGLGSAIVGLNSSGLSGISLNHSDIGGYTTITNPLKDYHRSPELFKRWAEMSAFTTVFRTHEGNLPDANHQFYSDADTQQHFAKMGQLHWALRAVFAELEAEAYETGLPVNRHPYLVFPEDRETIQVRYQFLLGDDLLVVPVWEKKAVEVKGYFPAGRWENIWTGAIVQGPKWEKVPAPLGQPAAFYRVGSAREQQLRDALKDITR